MKRGLVVLIAALVLISARLVADSRCTCLTNAGNALTSCLAADGAIATAGYDSADND